MVDDLKSLPFAERKRLLSELRACTHTCFIDGCQNEAVHTCKHHPFPQYDWTDYDEAGICAEHWGEGVGDRCHSCQPEIGPRTKPTVMDLMMEQCMRNLADEMDRSYEALKGTVWSGEGFKVGQHIEVRRPERVS